MAPYSSDLLWTEHIAECWRIDCDEPDHVRSRRFAKWDWYVIGGDYDGLVNGDEHPSQLPRLRTAGAQHLTGEGPA